MVYAEVFRCSCYRFNRSPGIRACFLPIGRWGGKGFTFFCKFLLMVLNKGDNGFPFGTILRYLANR